MLGKLMGDGLSDIAFYLFYPKHFMAPKIHLKIKGGIPEINKAGQRAFYPGYKAGAQWHFLQEF